ncbi:MAG: GNAT family N-acetyltransferase [Candidatus Nanoarchaeia archaeon]|nr:GNAT family N-acetyltransferase [Candidatus Haiyanarchaeum thermophilum]MCW1303052.1 GNAT family N-acetyltransferase [Candidatus Haiyanarchaeum thermophilum]MCW1304129.1 GNAT family N-acetyltransferase [Candidatus Haiyanarchaeum thermophilum]MCW1306838.1 GNAT family N-acetyltransferase [Candidatus Haiyanarchaeum thermophilum]MCW1307080.1 GNAT family N-acetyltransferase [Candidatus Haiyanarchaeum thermophilum]
MIREARKEDVNSILQIINESNRKSFSQVIPKEYFRQPILTLEDLLQDFEKMKFLVYEENGLPIGVAGFYVKPEEGVCRIRWFSVHPEYQGRGIGSKMMEFLQNEAKKLGLRKMRVVTLREAYWAVNFYSKCGYREVERIPRPWGTDVVLEKEL